MSLLCRHSLPEGLLQASECLKSHLNAISDFLRKTGSHIIYDVVGRLVWPLQVSESPSESLWVLKLQILLVCYFLNQWGLGGSKNGIPQRLHMYFLVLK